MKKVISTELTDSNITLVIDLLAEIPSKLANLSAVLTGEGLIQPLAPGERSITGTLAHLLNCEARTSENIYLALLTEVPLVIDIHPERQFGKLLRYDLLTFPDLLAYFELRRVILLHVLGRLSAADWSRSIREAGKKRQESVYWLARSLALHEAEHLADLAEKLGRSG